jgi:hypothetical protein
MASRTSLRRCAAAWLAAIALGCAGLAPSALAQSGNGLYEPFPEAAVKQRAQRYVERLGDRAPGAGRRFSDAQLARGVFVSDDQRLAPAKRGEATARAGSSEPADMALPLQLLLLLAALALPSAALIRRGRAREA